MANIRSYSYGELAELVKSEGLPRFRADQLIKWLYQQGVTSFDEMSNLPKSLRSQLEREHPLYNAKLVEKQISQDGTRKYLFEYHDGARIETVAIPSTSSGKGSEKLTVCFSTQAGCAIGCIFCATGCAGFTRNLEPGEMIEQIIYIQNDMKIRVSNLVAMGQGEPFLNYKSTLAALHIANSAQGLNIGARHITVSTCGIIPGIQKFSQQKEQYTLAVSLHSAEQSVRDELMPKMAQYPLSELKSSLLEYIDKTNRRVTLEYLMIKGVNDSDIALAALKKFCKGLHSHVNLLPLNAIEGSFMGPSSPQVVRGWQNALQKVGIETTLRNSRGSDIDGACGQLNNSVKQK